MNCDCKYCDPWMMAAENFTAQNQIRGPDSDSTTHSSGNQSLNVTHLYMTPHQKKKMYRTSLIILLTYQSQTWFTL